MSYCYPKAIRLLRRSQFKRFDNTAQRKVGRFIIVDIRSNQSEHTRLGVTVTRRFGKAHERNRFKRLVREVYRHVYRQLPPSHDLNIRPRRIAKNATLADIHNELMTLI